LQVTAAQRWMDAGVFYHVTRSTLFSDSNQLYRFKEDEVGAKRLLCFIT
jgi:hypothetical protein